MKKSTLYLLGIGLTIVVGVLLYCRFCHLSCCGSAATTMPSSPFLIEGEGFYYKSSSNFSFKTNSDELALPINDSIPIGVAQLSAFLSQHSNVALSIEGFTTSDEQAATTIADLGLARAEALKLYFIGHGIAPDRISTKSNTAEQLPMAKGLVNGAAAYALASKDDKAVAAFSQSIFDGFRSGSATLPISDNIKSELSSIKCYLIEHKTAQLHIVGHTDNVGSRAFNLTLSQKRAENFKKELVALSVDAQRIITEGKAFDLPVADNNSAEGRAKNRRVEISLQN